MDGNTEISGGVIRAAIEVHRELGPGLLESGYRACLVHELRAVGLRVEAEVPLPVLYRGVKLECGYRVDLPVEDRLIVELKSVHVVDAVHMAQLLTYLKLSRRPVGLLINFNATLLKRGIRRVVSSSGAWS